MAMHAHAPRPDFMISGFLKAGQREMKIEPAEGRCIFMKTIIERINKAYAVFKKKPVLHIICLANVLNLIIEMLCRRSVAEGLRYMVGQPFVFEYNAMIIMLTLTFALLFQRREFVLVLVSFIWLSLAVTDCVLLSFRTTPLAFTDFTLFNSVRSIVGNYLTIWQTALIVILFAALTAGIIWFGIRSPKTKVKYSTSLFSIAGFALCLLLGTSLSLKAKAVSSEFPNLADAYEQYGFAYCFSASIVDKGIDEPDDYSEYRIDEIRNAIGEDEELNTPNTPNIIFVQLESFIDVNDIIGYTYSENPVPVFSALEEEYSSGYLTVPAIGAGTANTEFEVLTGMSLDYFGTGEYPYKTILQSATCESICYNLKELGYACHAIHNHSGTFYDRNRVFENLGFDTFTPLEYMQDVEFTPRNWAKDAVLTGEVIKALKSTPGRDFIYTITVQGHGRYPGEFAEETNISVSGIESAEDKIAFEYYLKQIHETDEFIGELIDELAAYKEPVVLVLFGDHLPNFDFEDGDLINGSAYQTGYVIWTSFKLIKSDRDLNSYQLSAYVMERLGIDSGVLSKLHQRYSGESDYQNALELLQYDMLYGEKYIYGGKDPYTATDIKMGVSDISISGARYTRSGYLIVKGRGFTQWSVVCVDGEEKETVVVDGNTLVAHDVDRPEKDSAVTVAQIGKDKEILGMTGEYIWE